METMGMEMVRTMMEIFIGETPIRGRECKISWMTKCDLGAPVQVQALPTLINIRTMDGEVLMWLISTWLPLTEIRPSQFIQMIVSPALRRRP